MNGFPFEDGRKRELRERCIQLIDAAELSLLPKLEEIPFPEDTKITGALMGDLQARDSDGLLHVFCLRPTDNRAIPGWLQNWARAALDINDIRLHVVTYTAAKIMVDSCRSCGAGLLQVGVANAFDTILLPSREYVDMIEVKFGQDIQSLRRRLENKIRELKLTIDASRNQVLSSTVGVKGDRISVYLSISAEKEERLREWGGDISGRIDIAQANHDQSVFTSIRKVIDTGPEW